MTREEAYNRIDVIIAKYEIDDEYVTITNSKDYDALRMARELLEQEPCTDAISRQAVLEIMDWGWKKGIYPTNKIANLPLVSPKQSFESMTNGEVIKALFPDNPIKEVLEQSLLSEIGENWWNAQYGGDAE